MFYNTFRETITVKHGVIMKQYRVAVTGGIGSGKSTVCDLLRKRGFPVYSCDEISKRLFQEPFYQEKLLSIFPMIAVDGVADRKKLAELVFNDETQLQRLNDFTHPLIMDRLRTALQQDTSALVFAEVPLLFEGGFENDFDFVIVVERNLEQRIQAVCARDSATPEAVSKRIARQWDYQSDEHRQKMKNPAYFSMNNDGTEMQLDDQLDCILKKLPTI